MGKVRVVLDRAVSREVRLGPNCAAEFANSAFEPMISIDPRNTRHLAASWYRGFSASNAATAVSFDAGRHWSSRLVPGVSRCSGASEQGDADPWISFGPDGDAYVSSIPLRTPVQPSSIFFTGIVVSHSSDARRWSPPVAVAPVKTQFNDKDSITADPFHPGSAYVVWSRRYGAEAESGDGYFSFTHDHGRTWSPPALIYRPPVPFLIPSNSQLLVEPDGRLVELFNQINLSSSIPGDQIEVPWKIMAIRSRDRGRTWSAPVTVATLPQYGSALAFRTANGQVVRTPALSSQGEATNGELYVAWAAVKSHDSHIILSSSRNDGVSWSRPVTVARTRSPRLLVSPAVGVAGDGTIGVSYYSLDSKASGSLPTHVRVAVARSPSGPWRSSGVAGPFDYRQAPKVGGGPEDSGSAHFLGDYFGLAGMPAGFGVVYARPSPRARRDRGPSEIHVAILGLRPVPGQPRRIRLDVNPHRACAGRRVSFRVRVRGRGGPLTGVRIAFAGRTVRTSWEGTRLIWRRLTRPGRYPVHAYLPGFRAAVSSVVVRRASACR